MLNLTEEQKVLINSNSKYIRIVALPGSGKTTSLVAKIESMIQKGSDPSRMLICTFTNKAAREIKARINEKLIEMGKSINIDELWVSTIHSACVRLLRLYGDRIGLNNFFHIADEHKQQRIISQAWEKFAPKGTKEIDYLYKISYIKNQSLTFYDHSEFNKLPKFKEIFDEYHYILRKENLLDFDDLLLYTNSMLSNVEILSNIRLMFDLVMVDEVQDINLVQYEIFKKIVLAPHIRYIVVGDDDQCIYSFRGSDPKYLMHNFAVDFVGSQVIYLSLNHRCPDNIVRLSEQVILPVSDRMNKKLVAVKKDVEPIEYDLYLDQDQEAYSEIKKLKSIIQKEKDIWDNSAVLFRTQRQSRVLEEACMRLEVPYKVIGAMNFFDRKEVKDVIAFLKVVSGQHDNSDIERIINTPTRGIGSTSVKKLKEINENLLETLKYRKTLPFVKGKLALGLDLFMDIVEKYKVSINDSAEKISSNIISYLKEIDYYNKVFPHEQGEKLMMRQGNIDELILAISKYLNSGKTLLDYFDYIASLDVDDDDDKKGISLITMHASKGLEFNNVFIVGVQDGLIPHIKATSSIDIDSERRLLYVALTRSKKRLNMSAFTDASVDIPCYFFDIKGIDNYIQINDYRNQFYYKNNTNYEGW